MSKQLSAAENSPICATIPRGFVAHSGPINSVGVLAVFFSYVKELNLENFLPFPLPIYPKNCYYYAILSILQYVSENLNFMTARKVS